MSSDDDSEGENQDPVDQNYFDSFRQHLQDVREHVNGIFVEDEDEKDEEDAGQAPKDETHWSSEEKNKFFHALSIYSRLRPDLIADSIETKTAADVCIYIDVLDEAAAEFVSEDDDADERPSFRAELPRSFEVSDDWVSKEEKQASLLLSRAQELEREEREQKRELMKGERKHELQDQFGAEEDAYGQQRRMEEFKRWENDQTAKWKKADTFGSLNEWHLRRMATVSKNATLSATATDDVEMDDEEDLSVVVDSELQSQVMEPEDIPLHPILDNEELLLPSSQTAEFSFAFFDEDLLDAIPKPHSALDFAKATRRSPPPDHSSLLSAPSLHPSASASVSTVPTSLNGGDGDSVDPEEIAAAMSPKSRRRYKKMLHMRQKRGNVSTSTQFLKTGRRAKEAHPDNQVERDPSDRKRKRPPTEDDEVAVEVATPNGKDKVYHSQPHPYLRQQGPKRSTRRNTSDPTVIQFRSFSVFTDTSSRQPTPHPDSSQGDLFRPLNDYRYANYSGMTLSEQAKKVLQDCQVTPDTLREDGLGLFHLNKFAGFMRLYRSIHCDFPLSTTDSSTEKCSIASEISASCIALLEAYVVEFCDQVIKRAIFNRESELAMKKTKAWQIKGELLSEVTPANVQHALQVMNVEMDRRRFFKRLLHAGPYDPSVPLPQGDASDGDGDGDEGVDEDETSKIGDVTMSFPILHPLPECLFFFDRGRHSSVRPLRPGLALEGSVDDGEEDLLADETDEEALMQELEEEEDLNNEDEEEAEENEEELWRNST